MTMSATILNEVLNAVSTIFGIGTSFAGLGGPAAGAAAGAASTLMSGAIAAVSIGIEQQKNDTLQSRFTTASNQLMSGRFYNDADTRSYVSGSAFLACEGVDKNTFTDAMIKMMISAAINQLYCT
ncbi:hypothetical protein QQX98_010522 [Neonectria punicea]|uniref:Uncharacterized protein n=1 Tax=Neonectria punicea TaxID=979145 RepID=A0ABR1GP92_9HYPO